MKFLRIRFLFCALSGITLLPLPALPEESVIRRLPADYWNTRPERRDEPLRFENINDIEVSEIKSLMTSLYPGAIVYISGVVVGCPCQDGPQCSEQVWSAAVRGEQNYELMLSRIDETWQLGPLQDWWLAFDRLQDLAFRAGDLPERISYDEYRLRLAELELAYPYCASVDTLAAPVE